jgi:ornithine carbamoyltransferase
MRRTDDAHFMHCLPVRRNVVVDDDVLDGPGSLILDQAENRLHAQTALLEELVAATPAPRRADAREVLA